MRGRTRSRSTPLSMRLLAVVMLPLLAVGVLGTQRVAAERDAAADASALVDEVELRSAIADIVPPAQMEQTALAGLAGIDRLHLARERVVGVTGVDFETLAGANEAALTDAFAHLRDRHGERALGTGTTVAERIADLERRLVDLRDRSDARLVRPEEVVVFFDELNLLLHELVTTDGGSATSPPIERHRVRLEALGDVLLSAGRLNNVIVDGFLTEPDPEDRMRAETLHDVYVTMFVSMLSPAERIEFDTTRALAGVSPQTDLGDLIGTDGSVDADGVRIAANTVLGQLDYLEALADYSAGFHDRAAAEVQAAAADARLAAHGTQIVLWSIAAVTLVLVGWVLWSVLVPLRRLARRADSVGSGDLGLAPLALKGPRDVRSLTGTMNEMSAVLGRVNDRIRRLASGDIDAHYDADLPGPIGVSLRDSVQHLASVTRQLHRSKALASAIVEQADDSIWTIDDRLVILSANSASARLTGCEIHEQVGRPITDFLTNTGGEADVKTRRDPTRVLVAASVVDAGGERVTALIGHDISERSRFEARLTYQAMHDALTGLPNRFALLEHLAAIGAETPGELAVLYLDLDGFKAVNDVGGHAVGDRVLAEVAQRLASSVSEHDFVGRLGGDEFVVVSQRFATPHDAIELGHRIVSAIERPDPDAAHSFSLSVSVGIAIPPAGTAPADVLGQADSAVYQAKRLGRGRVVLFDREMQAHLDAEAELELALGRAIGNDELVLHLQPVFDLKTGWACGAEALVRWERPDHGLVSPGEFIPLAERSNLILDLDRWVLRSACERLAAWRERDPNLKARIAVNISGRHLSEGDLFLDVTDTLNRTGADPSMLELELTETHLLEDMQRASNTLNQLRSLGITIAVDDFGTGYSSMTYLRDLPVDVIKIDRSFVERATEPGYDSTLIEALITIARALDLRVVAEGIENHDQLSYVRVRGCQAAQGYLMARPMSIADAETVIFTSTSRWAAPVVPSSRRPMALVTP